MLNDSFEERGRAIAREIADRYGFEGKRRDSFMQHVENALETAGGVLTDSEDTEPEDPDSDIMEALDTWMDILFPDPRLH